MCVCACVCMGSLKPRVFVHIDQHTRAVLEVIASWAPRKHAWPPHGGRLGGSLVAAGLLQKHHRAARAVR